MPLADRQEIFKRIEGLCGNRALVCWFNFDRPSTPQIPGLTTHFHADAKEGLFRVLKESGASDRGVDLCLYTRGGDTNAVWPLVTLIREFDPDFRVLVPFRAHSGGTLVALAAREIVMGPLSELSPIDPTTGNQFNPRDPNEPRNRLGISVEDVTAYSDFIKKNFAIAEDTGESGLSPEDRAVLGQFLDRLTQEVHPLALGNVHRVYQQIQRLADALLSCHSSRKGRDNTQIIIDLTTRFYSHLHMIAREEAQRILGEEHVVFAEPELAEELDTLLRRYEDDFRLRQPYFLGGALGDAQRTDVRFVGGAVESKDWSYLFVTEGTIFQFSNVPNNVQVQIPPGQPMPLIPGLPRQQHFEISAQGWEHNTEPKGVTT